MKGWGCVLRGVTLAVLTVSLVVFSMRWLSGRSEPFDRGVWESSPPPSAVRRRMGKWIGEKDLLIGKTRSEVWELLGPPGGDAREYESYDLDRPFWGRAVLVVAYTPEGLVRDDWYEVID